MSAKGSLSAARARLMNEEDEPRDDRFRKAAEITARRPTGTSPRAHHVPANVAVHDDSGAGTVLAAIRDVLDNPLNARTSYKETRIAKLHASILERSQLQPALACLTADLVPLLQAEDAPKHLREAILDASGSPRTPYLLLGGHYRKKAVSRIPDRALEIKLTKIRTLLDLYALSYAENDEREQTTAIDDAMAWQNLLESGVARTQEDIATVTGKSRTVVVKTLALLKLPEPVKDVLRDSEEPYSAVAAYALTQLATKLPHDRLLALAEEVVTGKISTRKLESLVASAGAGRKTKELSRQYKFGGDDGAIKGVLKHWDSGRVVLDVEITDPQQAEALANELRARFGPDASQLTLR